MNELLNMYVLMHIFLIVMAIYTRIKLSKDIVTVIEERFFRLMIWMFVFYIFTSGIWSLFEYGKLDLPEWVFILNSSVSYLALALIAFGLYVFVMFRHSFAFAGKKAFWYLSSVPLLVIVVSLIVSAFTGVVFSVEKGDGNALNIVNGPLYPILLICTFFFFFVILVLSIINAVKTKSNLKRKEFIWLAASMGIIMASVLGLSILFLHLTILPMAIFASLYIMFTSLQQSGINNDSLTGLNNRRRAYEYLSEQIAAVSEEQPLLLFVLDVNYFKNINDFYGHIEGDGALILVADIVREVATKYYGFAARYGGDEFIFSIKPHLVKGDSFSTEDVIRNLDKSLLERCKTEGKPYTLTASIGYVTCDDPKLPLGFYFGKADEMLYKVKRDFHNRTGK